jgi:hypothetical protein
VQLDIPQIAMGLADGGWETAEAVDTIAATNRMSWRPKSVAISSPTCWRRVRHLSKPYTADKINYQILGNLVPHLHAHIQPRFYGDAYPGQPVSGAPEQPVFLTADEYHERIAAIRAAVQLL